MKKVICKWTTCDDWNCSVTSCESLDMTIVLETLGLEIEFINKTEWL